MKWLFLLLFALFLPFNAFCNAFSQPPLIIHGEEFEFDERSYQKCYIAGLDASFWVDSIPDGIKDHLRRGIYWEGGIGTLIQQHTKEGTIAIDVGAHIGIHTITMSRKVGPQGAVFAFEPQKKIYVELTQNLKLNNCTNVIPIRKALGNSYETVQMNARNPINEGGTSVGSGGDFARMVPLDSLNLHNVSLIKIDVESYEYYFFQGAKNTILKNRPVLIFEIMGNYDYQSGTPQVRQQFDRVISLVESYGYKVELIFGNDYIAFPLEK